MTDYTTKEPSYAFILRTIREKIDKGELNPGDRLPTEEELRVQFGGVSRGTVRKAMDVLENLGYINRRSGLGTFVTRPMKKETGEIVSFSTQIERIGLESKTVVLSAGLIQTGLAEGRVSEAFPDLENQNILRIRRLKIGNDEPYAIQIVYLDPRRVPGLLDLPVERLERLFQLYKDQYNIVIREVDEQLRAMIVSDSRRQSCSKSNPVRRLLCVTAFHSTSRGSRSKFCIRSTGEISLCTIIAAERIGRLKL